MTEPDPTDRSGIEARQGARGNNGRLVGIVLAVVALLAVWVIYAFVLT
ncbi:hypothetical protein [Lutibaculum baratangense]|uniref:Uncharacterized protein n=1 Tax=Lutibaculum baratangense AMV1 TaxID=631454 RepID=V4RS42_9HYPH|nr:hypothetical protein [Lutibaculum baratangense]ESR25940.1 hypothetical protein N177_1275 [Lutibaculum baratangense AMV1]